MKSKIQLLLNIMLFAFVLNINTARAKEVDALSFVLTNEGSDRMIERLESAGCNNLYEALVYLRKNMANDAPTVLTNNMDTLLDSLKKLSGIGEVFTASLHDFIGAGNTPVGINSDGTFILADFKISYYKYQEGFETYFCKELITYSISPDHNIYLGTSTLNGTKTNYYAFATAWSMVPNSFVLTNEGNDKIIERLESAGCKNLYDALVYLRNSMASDAPAILTGNMDALLDSLNNSGGEVFSLSLHDFTNDNNNPVGINSDGTLIICDFSVFDYDGHKGFERYYGKELFTYVTSPEHYIFLGSSLNGDTETNYLAFAVAWGDSTITGVFDDIENNEIIVSPNPAGDYIEINALSSEPPEGFKPSEGYIYNALGECVINYELQITNYEFGIRINVSNLPAGVYLINAGNIHKKFVKI